MGNSYDAALMKVKKSELVAGTDFHIEQYNYNSGEDRIRIVQKFTSSNGEKINVMCKGIAPSQWDKLMVVIAKMSAPEAPAVAEKPKPQAQRKTKIRRAA